MKRLGSLCLGCALVLGSVACDGEIGAKEPVPPGPVLLAAPQPVADDGDIDRFVGEWFAVSGNRISECRQGLAGSSNEIPEVSGTIVIALGPGPDELVVDDMSGCVVQATAQGDSAFAASAVCPAANPPRTIVYTLAGDVLIAEAKVLVTPTSKPNGPGGGSSGGSSFGGSFCTLITETRFERPPQPGQ
jgi:hypothetical protein